MSRNVVRSAVVLGAMALVGGCGGAPVDEGDPAAVSADPGALVGVRMQSTVGVLLDEIPAAIRARVAADYLARPAAFWTARAHRQTEATLYRLAYRNFFYSRKGQLPLPPEEQWSFQTGAARRATIDGHDAVVADYTFTSTLLATVASVAESERALTKIGGTWDEPFVLPLDPEHLLERTGYACMDESDFPPNSVDSENALEFYDQDCKGGKNECHVTQPAPKESCVAALQAKVGRVATSAKFTRLAWSAALADSVRVNGTGTVGADLEVIPEGLDDNRLIYRYIPETSCAIQEGCVTGRGWRRLLQFSASVKNLGATPVHIGDVGPMSLPAQHNMFEFSACHGHNHFSHYGNFTYDVGGQALGSKRAFCLESVTRYSNNETTPLTHPYGCAYQGVQAGWGDDYIAGIECQWVDVTPVASGVPVTGDLRFQVNPDDFLCEGTLVTDANGQPQFESTSFTTVDGKPVDRFQCAFTPGYQANNLAELSVTVPAKGSYVSAPCRRDVVGPLRNCGFAEQDDGIACTPGAPVQLDCVVADGTRPQVLRVCEHSAALGTGLACTYREALANAVIDGKPRPVTFACPTARDEVERGGRYATFTAPVVGTDAAQGIVCTPRR